MLKNDIKEVLYLGHIQQDWGKEERVIIKLNASEIEDVNSYTPESQNSYRVLENLLNGQQFYISFFELQKFINEATII